ncbi:glycosyltransferase family 2 protein [Hymenobacter fodinae]|nr:glycosyltransferase family A protein [Hymenobacter fodinae]
MDNALLLSLVIPTYNRSKYLDKQIGWAVESIGDKWDNIELVVCDNASEDATKEICAKWKKILDNKITIIVNNNNIGLVRNCLLGISKAKGEFVWLIGDDDPIQVRAVASVLSTIKDNRQLNVIHLNHRCVSGIDGSIIIPKFYSVDRDIITDKGSKELSKLLESHHTGGFMFITANVINRNAAVCFMEDTPPEEDSLLAYPMLLNAGLASMGGFCLLESCYLDCVYHQSSWSNKYEEVSYEEVPRTLFKLKSKGVSNKAILFCLNHQYQGLHSLKDTLYILRKDPLYFKTDKFKKWAKRWALKNSLKWKLVSL